MATTLMQDEAVKAIINESQRLAREMSDALERQAQLCYRPRRDVGLHAEALV